MHRFNALLYPPGPVRPREPERWLDHVTRTLYDVKHVVVVGVHGWFPIRLILRFVGEPTGTSPRFVHMMTRAVHDFLFERGINLPPDAITGIALEGPGRVEERIEALYAQLLRHREALGRADMVFFAAHSQGSVVSAHLLSRLVANGVLDPERTRTCLLAMAGISHGPFPFLKQNILIQYIEQQAARELFEFCDDPERDPNSNSARYKRALEHILSSGVRVVAVGSWFDQVVPLYSALLHRFTHPLLFRAVHISAQDYQPDFLTSLVTFAVRLRNRGIWDHGLLVHLSEVVAGSLISGTQGHSSVYEEPDCYLLAVQWLLSNHGIAPRRAGAPDPDSLVWTSQSDAAQSGPPPGPYGPLTVHPPPPIHASTGRINPFHLPWVMHEILVSPSVAGDEGLRRELRGLVEQFRRWAPPDDRKAWKELKWRLEALASVPTAKL
ncbi:hypothetical protein DFJ74DRAFT_609352 [Hyaloraphidium curvatum]|nr:hypothetical protein DFJ74DRAFT_609352 [Hyaloraphidium curvatum]